MTRILLIETASPKRLQRKAEDILRSGLYSEPEINILCREESRRFFQDLPEARIHSTGAGESSRALKQLRGEKFDIVFLFWTGEKKHRRLKLAPLRLKAGRFIVSAGDGNEFRPTCKAMCRHALFRMRHPLPTDHCDFEAPEPGMDPARSQTRVLVVQSAEPDFVLRALDQLHAERLFKDPCFTLFCRSAPLIADRFRGHPLIDRLLLHTESRDSAMHWRNLRAMKFDAAVLFMTGDRSYRKIKIFAFFLGVPLKSMLIFNETSDCFFFNWKHFFALAWQRMRERSHLRTGTGHADSAKILGALILKSLFFPIRFFWLLFVWVRLRYAGMKSTRNRHDDSIPLPPLPGA